MISRFLLERKKIILTFSFITIAISVMALTFSQINKPKTTQSKASEISPTPTIPNVSRKKGVGGAPFKGALNRAYDLKISWFYNWAYTPFWGSDPANWSSDVWNNPRLEFVPMWAQKPYLNSLGITSCKTAEDQQKMHNAIVTRMNYICSRGYCNRNPGRYHLIGNEPDGTTPDQDGMPYSTDLPGDAATCYGTIIKAIKSKDSTAKFIILGLSKENRWDNYNFLNGFIFKWKQIWGGTDIGNLADVITGWDLHTYYLSSYYGNSYASCPTNDSWPRNYLSDIDGLMQSVFGKKVPNQELWISEMGSLFNLPSRNNPTERNKFLRHMECLVNVYENSPVVTRYAWFYAGIDPKWEATSLYNQAPNSYCVRPADGGNYCLTDLGEKYASLPDNILASPTPQPDDATPPVLTNTPVPSPSSPPTPVSGNRAPVITAPGFLPAGTAGQDYKPNGRIYYIEGYDEDVDNNLTMKYQGVPPGIFLKNCSQAIVNNRRAIKCEVSGFILADAIKKMYYGRILLIDSKGAQTEKNVAIQIK